MSIGKTHPAPFTATVYKYLKNGKTYASAKRICSERSDGGWVFADGEIYEGRREVYSIDKNGRPWQASKRLPEDQLIKVGEILV